MPKFKSGTTMKIVIFFLMILSLSGCSYDYYFLVPQVSISKQNEYFQISNQIFYGSKYYDFLSISISIKNNYEKKVAKLIANPTLLNSYAELKFVKIFDNINDFQLIGKCCSVKSLEDISKNMENSLP